MIEINLLPKDYLKGGRAISFGKMGLYAVAGAAAMIVMMVALAFYQMRQLDNLQTNIERANERASMLQKDIRVVDALTDVKEKINRRMRAVERLDRHRSVWVRILENVAADVPEFVWLAAFKEKPDEGADKAKTGSLSNTLSQGTSQPAKPAAPVDLRGQDTLPAFRPVEIEGYSYTLNSLAAFMIALMRSDFFDRVELVKSEETIFPGGDEKAYNFIVSCNVHYLSDDDLRGMVASADFDEEVNEADFEQAQEPTHSGGHARSSSDARNSN